MPDLDYSDGLLLPIVGDRVKHFIVLEDTDQLGRYARNNANWESTATRPRERWTSSIGRHDRSNLRCASALCATRVDGTTTIWPTPQNDSYLAASTSTRRSLAQDASSVPVASISPRELVTTLEDGIPSLTITLLTLSARLPPSARL